MVKKIKHLFIVYGKFTKNVIKSYVSVLHTKQVS